MTQWIRVECSVIRHPKVLVLAARLNKSPYEVVGHLVALWSWAAEIGIDYHGLLPDGPPEIIAQAFGVTRRKQAESAVAALIETGFMDRREDGRLVLHDWYEYNGRALERRAKEVKRAHANRERTKQASSRTGNDTGNDTRSVRGYDTDDTGRNDTERNETNNTPPSGNRTRTKTAEIPPTFVKVWIDTYKGDLSVADRATLRKLLDAHGEADTLRNFQNYLGQTDAQFVKVSHFAKTFGSWANRDQGRRLRGEPSVRSLSQRHPFKIEGGQGG